MPEFCHSIDYMRVLFLFLISLIISLVIFFLNYKFKKINVKLIWQIILFIITVVVLFVIIIIIFPDFVKICTQLSPYPL